MHAASGADGGRASLIEGTLKNTARFTRFIPHAYHYDFITDFKAALSVHIPRKKEVLPFFIRHASLYFCCYPNLGKIFALVTPLSLSHFPSPPASNVTTVSFHLNASPLCDFPYLLSI